LFHNNEDDKDLLSEIKTSREGSEYLHIEFKRTHDSFYGCAIACSLNKHLLSVKFP